MGGGVCIWRINDSIYPFSDSVLVTMHDGVDVRSTTIHGSRALCHHQCPDDLQMIPVTFVSDS